MRLMPALPCISRARASGDEPPRAAVASGATFITGARNFSPATSLYMEASSIGAPSSSMGRIVPDVPSMASATTWCSLNLDLKSCRTSSTAAAQTRGSSHSRPKFCCGSIIAVWPMASMSPPLPKRTARTPDVPMSIPSAASLMSSPAIGDGQDARGGRFIGDQYVDHLTPERPMQDLDLVGAPRCDDDAGHRFEIRGGERAGAFVGRMIDEPAVDMSQWAQRSP